ncbi:DEAD-box ATP-dependent RNA helicase 50 [Turnera subulata]|uniref:DEAD-box ATP-dependent RNA helicase 50 n=1 Tax=Turnera subulata TaxID=218843 RepID=A0A9Q0G5F2_9ROSI|nr:DEAD-box ATP-dependent RNA helicase 50 [Turnera subulata]
MLLGKGGGAALITSPHHHHHHHHLTITSSSCTSTTTTTTTTKTGFCAVRFHHKLLKTPVKVKAISAARKEEKASLLKHQKHHHHPQQTSSDSPTITTTSQSPSHSPSAKKTNKIIVGSSSFQKASPFSGKKFQDQEDNTQEEPQHVKTTSNNNPHSKTSFRGWGDGEGGSSGARGGGGGHRFKAKIQKAPPPPQSHDFFSRRSFKDLGCAEFMIQSLKTLAFFRPSHIQAMAFVPVIDGNTCILADQSGSGKTLAYLLPLIQRLRQEEQLLGRGDTSSGGPRVLILVPTSELASQVLNNCRSLSKSGVPFRSMVVTGGFRQRTQVENLEQGVDVLIATPGRFIAVLDEVDVLFNDEDFEVSLQSLINSSPVNTQFLFVTATLPVDVYNKLVETFPDCQVISGPGMHRTSMGLEEILIDCSGEDESEKTPEMAFRNKKSAFLELVEQKSVARTIVFCNKIETCRKVENVLKRFDRKGSRVRVLPFHAALPQDLRLANMKEFMTSESDRGSLFLVCTDRASRGIDFAGVDHVVLFDFPRDPSEYVRRVGRTARGAGGKGRAFIFAVGKQVFLARKIIERNQKGRPLHHVPFANQLTS